MKQRRIGQCDATDAAGRPCILVTAHAIAHAADRKHHWTMPGGRDRRVMNTRATAERIIGRPGYVRVTIDHCQFELSLDEFNALMQDGLNILQSVIAAQKRPAGLKKP